MCETLRKNDNQLEKMRNNVGKGERMREMREMYLANFRIHMLHFRIINVNSHITVKCILIFATSCTG